jgi:hypothetical protein
MGQTSEDLNDVPEKWKLHLSKKLSLCCIYRTPSRAIAAFSLCVQGGWEVRYHIADYAEKIKMVAV